MDRLVWLGDWIACHRSPTSWVYLMITISGLSDKARFRTYHGGIAGISLTAPLNSEQTNNNHTNNFCPPARWPSVVLRSGVTAMVADEC